MDSKWWTRLVIILVVTLGSAWFLVPTYYSFFVLDRADRNKIETLKERLPAWAPPAKYRLSLGLDLQGGIHMVMRVDTHTAMVKYAERRATQMVGQVKSKKLGEVTAATDPEKLEVTLTAADPATMDSIEKELVDVFGDFSKVSRQGATLVMAVSENYMAASIDQAVELAQFKIRERIDQWGVAEVDVRRMGTDSIQVSLPGQSDPERAKELVGITGQLEFRIVNQSPTATSALYQSSPPNPAAGIRLVNAGESKDREAPPTPFLESENMEALKAYVKDKGPAGEQYFLHCVRGETKAKKCERFQTYLLADADRVTGDNLAGAEPSINPGNNEWVVSFEFNTQGARDFEELTGKNVNRLMAILLDDDVYTAPRINEKIGARGQITLGPRTTRKEQEEEAKMLALVLRSALPAPVSIAEVRQVGASLGDELIRKGTLAAIVGLALVVLFMALYYRVAGLVADVALILNGALILAGLALFGATLTLPGIAAFVLTLGIAVDANVLINERVREELREGKSARMAVDQGYDRAFWTIFDAHVTTLIAGFILMKTGTGPVQGFATALIIGIIASLFTSIVVTRVIQTYLVHGRNAERVSV